MAKPSIERRQHTRHPLGCPARLVDETGRHLASGKTVDISDGGLLMPVAPGADANPGQHLDVKLSVPRSTPNPTIFRSPAVMGTSPSCLVSPRMTGGVLAYRVQSISQSGTS